MSIFDDLSQAKVFENSKFFQDGRYIVEIGAVKFNQGGYKGDSFVIETRILAVKSDKEDAPQPGEVAAHVWRVDGDKKDIGRSTWMQFLTAMFQKQTADLNDTEWKNLSAKVIDQNSLAGYKVYLEVFTKKTKAGNDFTQHNWKGIAGAELLKEFSLTE